MNTNFCNKKESIREDFMLMELLIHIDTLIKKILPDVFYFFSLQYYLNKIRAIISSYTLRNIFSYIYSNVLDDIYTIKLNYQAL